MVRKRYLFVCRCKIPALRNELCGSMLFLRCCHEGGHKTSHMVYTVQSYHLHLGYRGVYQASFIVIYLWVLLYPFGPLQSDESAWLLEELTLHPQAHGGSPSLSLSRWLAGRPHQLGRHQNSGRLTKAHTWLGRLCYAGGGECHWPELFVKLVGFWQLPCQVETIAYVFHQVHVIRTCFHQQFLEEQQSFLFEDRPASA